MFLINITVTAAPAAVYTADYPAAARRVDTDQQVAVSTVAWVAAVAEATARCKAATAASSPASAVATAEETGKSTQA